MAIRYRTDAEAVKIIHDFLKADNLSSAISFITATAGDPESVMKLWIGLQCDLNNAAKDTALSEKLAWSGVEYGVSSGLKREAAVLLHNIAAFYTQNWDEGVSPEVAPRLVDAGVRQVDLRKDLPDQGSYGWALWDLGMAYLINGQLAPAIQRFDESIAVHRGNVSEVGGSLPKESFNSMAWCTLFKGKALLKLSLSSVEQSEGRKLMTSARDTILECGEDWEKEEVVKIIASVGIV